jgi:hypothetical protein
MQELEEGQGKRCDTVEELMADLNAKDLNAEGDHRSRS